MMVTTSQKERSSAWLSLPKIQGDGERCWCPSDAVLRRCRGTADRFWWPGASDDLDGDVRRVHVRRDQARDARGVAEVAAVPARQGRLPRGAAVGECVSGAGHGRDVQRWPGDHRRPRHWHGPARRVHRRVAVALLVRDRPVRPRDVGRRRRVAALRLGGQAGAPWEPGPDGDRGRRVSPRPTGRAGAYAERERETHSYRGTTPFTTPAPLLLCVRRR
jgi:hypothetical protein